MATLLPTGTGTGTGNGNSLDLLRLSLEEVEFILRQDFNLEWEILAPLAISLHMI